MADLIGLIESKHLVEISSDFNYLKATEKFIGLRLFPMVKTANMKLAIANLMDGADIPVMAFVHALDTEARIGDRASYSEIKVELLLIKEKLNQGEELKKKILDLGMSRDGNAILMQVFNDIENLISRVLTRIEVMACELLSTGKITVKENGVDVEIDFHLPATHVIEFSDWSNPEHNIVADLIKVKELSDDKIVRALIPKPIFAHVLQNGAMIDVAAKQGKFVTQEWARNYLGTELGMDLFVTTGSYKKKASDKNSFHFFKQDTITFLTTDGEVGKTFVTSTPEEDFGVASEMSGYVSVTQYKTEDPAGIWTKASAVALPCPANINSIYLATVSD